MESSLQTVLKLKEHQKSSPDDVEKNTETETEGMKELLKTDILY